MTPTIEEVKKTADVCGARQCRDMVKFTNEQLQAFAQYWKEEGRKEQCPSFMQPVVVAKDGVIRFKENVLVRALLDHGRNTGLGLNELSTTLFTDEYPDDWMHFAQLIGYSIGGYGELSYVTDESYEAAKELESSIRNNTGE